MKHRLFFVCLILFTCVSRLFCQIKITDKILNKDQTSLGKKYILDRYLIDSIIKNIYKKNNLANAKSMDKKIILMQIASTILQKAKVNNADITKVTIGNRILKKLGGKKALIQLNKHLNDKNFDVKYKFELKHYKAIEKQKYLRKLKAQEKNEIKKQIIRLAKNNLNLITNRKKENRIKRKLDKTSKLNFKPTFEGAPFPPVSIAGMNYHPPMHFNVNVFDYPNKRAHFSPYDRYKNVEKQKSNIKSKSIFTDKQGSPPGQ